MFSFPRPFNALLVLDLRSAEIAKLREMLFEYGVDRNREMIIILSFHDGFVYITLKS